MSSLQVNGLDDDLYDALRRRAVAADQTMSEYVVDTIRRGLRRQAKDEWMGACPGAHSDGPHVR